MKKVLTIVATLLCAFCFIAPIKASEADTKDTTVLYQVSESYEWGIHAAIDFGDDAGGGQSVSRTVDDQNAAAKVYVTKNVIEPGKKLNIAISSANNFALKSNANITGGTYTVKKSADGAALANNASVLEVAAGTNAGEQSLIFELTTAAVEIVGNYSDSLTYTATIVNAA